MKIYDRYIENSLKKSKASLRPLKVTIFIAVLTLSIFAFISSSIIKNGQEAAKKNYGDFHVLISTQLNQQKLSILEKNVNIDKLAFAREEGLEKVKGKDLTFAVTAIDRNYEQVIDRSLTYGRMPKTPKEIILPVDRASDLKLKLGDPLVTKDENGEEKTYTLVGFIDYDVNTWEKEAPAFIHRGKGQIESEASQVAIWYKNIRDSYDLTPELAQALGLDYAKAIEGGLLRYNSLYLSSHFVNSKDWLTGSISEKYPKIMGTGLLLIALFFVVVIKSIFTVWESSQIREYGLLLSIGAKKRDLKNLVLKRLYKLALRPVLLGLVFATILSILILKIMTYYYFLASENLVRSLDNGFYFTPNPLIYLGILLVTGLVLSFAALGPVWKLGKINVVDSMKLYRIGKGKKKKRDLKAKSFLKDISKINRGDQRGRVLFSSLSVSLGVFFLTLMLSLLTGLNLSTEYDSLDTMKNYDYCISYIHPKAFPKDLLGKLTDNFNNDYRNFRSCDFYILKENSYAEVLDPGYRKNFYDHYRDFYGAEEIQIKVIGLGEEKYQEFLREENISPEEGKKENAGILINRISTDFTKAKKLQTSTKALKEATENLVLGDYLTEYTKETGEKNGKVTIHILKYLEKEKFLKVPQEKNALLFVTSMDQYFSIIRKSIQAHTGMVTEEIYFNNPKMGVTQIKDLLSKQISSRDLEIASKESVNNFEYYSNRMVYSLFIAAALIAGGLGLTQAYSASSSMKEARKQEYTLLMVVGMDEKMLRKLSIKELNENMKFILAFSLLFLGAALFLAHKAYPVFSPFQIFRKINYLPLILYLGLIYLILRTYYLKILEGLELTRNSRII